MADKVIEDVEVLDVKDMERNQRERRAAEGAATIWKALAVVIAMLAAVYGASPIDVVPDSVPVAGLLDDLGVLAIAGLNLYQQFAKDQNSPVVKLVKYTKWIMVVLFIIAGLLLGGLIAAIVALVTMALN